MLYTFYSVLIDSRTGVTEMGGVCTRQTVDAVVFFCAPNFQNIDGVVKDAEYRKQIDCVATLIVLLTPNAPADISLRREVQYARQQGKTAYLVAAGESQYAFLPSWARSMLVYSLDNPEALLRALAVPQKTVRVPFTAPAPTAAAIHRPEPYAQLRQLLHTAPIVVLNGAPGSGKSTLAAQVCQDKDVLERFPDGVLWLSIGQAPDTASALEHSVLALFLAAPARSEAAQTRRQPPPDEFRRLAKES